MFMISNTISKLIRHQLYKTKLQLFNEKQNKKTSVMKRMRVEKKKNKVKIVNNPNTMSWFKWKAKKYLVNKRMMRVKRREPNKKNIFKMVNCSYIQCSQIKYFNVLYNYNNIMIRHGTLSKNSNEVFS